LQGIQIDLVAGASSVQKIALTPPKTKASLIRPEANKVALTPPNKKAPASHQLAKAPVRRVSSDLSKTMSPPQMTHSTPIKVSHSPLKSGRDVIVVLDAGHGGKDPGAKGPRKSHEKNVVLAITLKLKQLIDRQPGMHAVLTRSGDYYVGLRQRLDMARKYNGDIFVSIHADAFNNPHSSGASVFALSQGGATSEAARWIAEKENYSELGGVNLGDLDDSNGVVRSVLIDLSQTATINSSLQMGGGVLNQISHVTRLHHHKVEQARFMVLKSPDTPSILVETGFISNPVEESNLTNQGYQSRLSQAIFTGIKDYFWANPPHGTRIEAMASARVHRVSRGEKLPDIAARFGVSTQALLAANHLSPHASLSPGQKLTIPSSWA
jgi:N-acetylmuramoyl-L-alanine amidase